MTSATPGKCQSDLITARNYDFKEGQGFAFDVLILFQVEPFFLKIGEDRFRGDSRGYALPEGQYVKGIQAWCFQAEFCSNFTCGVHVRYPRP